MSHPKAYDPQQGYRFQILILCPGEREYEHLDYAINIKDKNELLKNYRETYDYSYQFKVITFPRKYWPKTIRLGDKSKATEGEIVHWDDPDEGISSGDYILKRVINSEMAHIERGESEAEVPIHELRRKPDSSNA